MAFHKRTTVVLTPGGNAFTVPPCFGFRVAFIGSYQGTQVRVTPQYQRGRQEGDAWTVGGNAPPDDWRWFQTKPDGLRIEATAVAVCVDVEWADEAGDRVNPPGPTRLIAGIGAPYSAAGSPIVGPDFAKSNTYVAEVIGDPLTVAFNGGALRTAKRTTQLYDSGLVAGGAQIQTGILDLTLYDSLLFILNVGAAIARGLAADVFLDDQVTNVFAGGNFFSTPAGGSATSMFAVGLGTGPLGGYNGTNMNIPLARFVRFTLTAAGANAGRMTIWAR